MKKSSSAKQMKASKVSKTRGVKGDRLEAAPMASTAREEGAEKGRLTTKQTNAAARSEPIVHKRKKRPPGGAKKEANSANAKTTRARSVKKKTQTAKREIVAHPDSTALVYRSEKVNGIQIETYMSLVHWIVSKVSGVLPAHVDRNDLVSEGYCGLVQAAHRYDKTRGTFATFARNRIRGSILDWLRSVDRLPRSARQTIKTMELMEADFLQKNNRIISTSEMASALDMSVDKLQKRQNRLEITNAAATVALIPKHSGGETSVETIDIESLSGSVPGPQMTMEAINDAALHLAGVISFLSQEDSSICLMTLIEGMDGSLLSSLLNLPPSKIRNSKKRISQTAATLIF